MYATPTPHEPLATPSPLIGQARPGMRSAPLQPLPIPHGAQHMGDQRGMGQKEENLKTFSGNPVEYKYWAERFMDHMSKVHIHWRHTLRWLSTTDEDLSYARLSLESVGPYNERASELAQKLEQTIVTYLPESLYSNREQLCGGPMQANNGFIMWRRLARDNSGTGDIVEIRRD